MSEAVLRAVAEGRIAPVYLLVGEATLLMEEFLGRLLDLLLPPGFRELNCEVIRGDACNPHDLLQRCCVLPAFSPRRVVVLKEADRLGREAWETFLPYLQRPAEQSCLILVASKMDERLKVVQRLRKQRGVIDFPIPKGAALARWVRTEVQARGKRIGEEATVLFLSRQSDNLHSLRQEIEKVCLFVDPASEITPGAVQAVSSRDVGTRIFDLTDAVSRQEAGVALHHLHDLLVSGTEAPRILGMLARQLRLLLKAKAAQDRGADPAKGPEGIPLPPFLVARLMADATRFPVKRIEAGLLRLGQLDQELKSHGRAHHALALERAIIELCARV
ncbi:MAG: DNA polymerase III subunit delta [Candidatus Methylomirabilales bacterium]